MRRIESEKPREGLGHGKRSASAIALGSTLAVLSVLFFVRVPTTDVELDVVASEVGFSLPDEQVLVDVLNLSAIGASGLTTARLPPEAGAAASTPVDEKAALVLTASRSTTAPGTVTLAPLVAPAGTNVTVRSTDVPNQYRLSLEHCGKDVRADVHGAVRIGWLRGPAEEATFRAPRSVVLQAGDSVLDLDLTLPEAAQADFAPQLEIADLVLARIDQYGVAERTLVRRVSTILSGVLYFESLDGRARQLRPNEAIRFAEARGQIQALHLRSGQIAMRFQGKVRGMTTGSDSARRSLMPTWFEWLSARHGLALLWGSTLYVFGLIAAVLRWWGIQW